MQRRSLHPSPALAQLFSIASKSPSVFSKELSISSAQTRTFVNNAQLYSGRGLANGPAQTGSHAVRKYIHQLLQTKVKKDVTKFDK